MVDADFDTELDSLPRMIAEAAEPLPDIDDPAFGALFDRFGDARVVCLGEASHGTSEFYRARAAISRRLIERHGFNIVAVEGDWPDCATVDRYVRHRPVRELDFRPFENGGLHTPLIEAGNPDSREAIVFMHGNSGSSLDFAGILRAAPPGAPSPAGERVQR